MELAVHNRDRHLEQPRIPVENGIERKWDRRGSLRYSAYKSPSGQRPPLHADVGLARDRSRPGFTDGLYSARRTNRSEHVQRGTERAMAHPERVELPVVIGSNQQEADDHFAGAFRLWLGTIHSF